MATDRDDITAALAARDRFARRLRSRESPAERLARFGRLQRQMFALLQSSPEGWQRFLRRNFRSRRTEVVDGEWRPVGPD